jgi:predicted alpha/beta hydrolase family esterase
MHPGRSCCSTAGRTTGSPTTGTTGSTTSSSSAGSPVRYPQLPDPDEPSLDAWLDAHVAELDACGTAESPSSATACPYRPGCTPSPVAACRVENVILVAPPSASVLAQIGIG